MRGQCHAPDALPPGKSPCAHCTGGWVAPCGKNSTLSGFDLRTVKAVVSLYIDYMQFRLTMILSTWLYFEQIISDISKGRSVKTSVTTSIYRMTRCNIHKTRIFSTVDLRRSTFTRYRR
jgi:hypothetical protein